MKGDVNIPPSDMFQDLVCDSGAPSMDCQLCGRTHFCTGDQSDEEPEQIERYRMNAAANPDKYCEDYDNDGLSFGTINGMQVVYGCPCNKLRKYEDFIWDQLIINYICRRTNKEREASERTASQLDQLRAAIARAEGQTTE